MTGLLKDLMSDKAEHVVAPQLDVDAIIEAGDRRVRRRRIATGTGIAAVAAAVITAVAVVPAMVDSGGPDPVHRPTAPDFSAPLPTYAVASAIYYGDETISVAPESISAFVRTDQGFVYATKSDDIYFTNGQTNEQIGTAADSGRRTLVADGPYAAWIDPTSAEPDLVVYSTSEDAEVLRTNEGSTADGQDDPFTQTAVLVLDGSSVYWHNSTGVVVTDVAAGSGVITLMPGASSDWLYDAVNGVLARASFDDITVTVSRDTQAIEPNFTGDFGTLSPDATRVATANGGEVLIFDVRSGNAEPGLPSYVDQATFLHWVDNDTYVAAVAGRGQAQSSAFTCSISTDRCPESTYFIGRFADVIAPDGS